MMCRALPRRHPRAPAAAACVLGLSLVASGLAAGAAVAATQAPAPARAPGAGRPGTWRFDLSTLGLLPGSLRVVAGEAAQSGSATVVFRLRGKPGERVVFTFDAGGEP